MSFTTSLYAFFLFFIFLFFLFIFLLLKETKNNLFRVFFLLASYVFYASWDSFSLILIIITSITDYFSSKLIYKTRGIYKKRLLLIISLIVNLGILFTFKYYAFFVKNLSDFLFFFNLSFEEMHIINLVLPVGISFYTFQSLSYTIDVFRGELEPERSFVKYLLYVSFFPQLVAGPIVPARFLLPQLENFEVDPQLLKLGLALILQGLIKKVLIADRLAPIVDSFYEQPSLYSWTSTFIAVISYSIQIFCDFSGYTDIARGSALLFGVSLPENFQAPYLSLSFTDFWRRWHITLSSWLKNYLYFSLGGNRKGKFRTSVNLLLTMLLGGLWHGASWNFLIWGFFHGALLVFEKYFLNLVFLATPVGATGGKFKIWHFLRIFLSWFWVYSLVTLLWIFFRSPNFEVTLLVLKKIFIYEAGLDFPKSMQNEFFFSGILLLLGHILYLSNFQLENFLKEISLSSFVLIFAVSLHIVIFLSKDSKPFIYFVF